MFEDLKDIDLDDVLEELEKLFLALAGAIFYPLIRIAAAIPRLIALLESVLFKYPLKQFLLVLYHFKHLNLIGVLYNIIITPFEMAWDLCIGIGYEVLGCFLSPLTGAYYGWWRDFTILLKALAVDWSEEYQAITNSLYWLLALDLSEDPDNKIPDFLFRPIRAMLANEANSIPGILFDLFDNYSDHAKRPDLESSLRLPATIFTTLFYPMFRIVILIPRLIDLWQSALLHLIVTPGVLVFDRLRQEGVLSSLKQLGFDNPKLVADILWTTIKGTVLEIRDVICSPITAAKRTWHYGVVYNIGITFLNDWYGIRPVEEDANETYSEQFLTAMQEAFEKLDQPIIYKPASAAEAPPVAAAAPYVGGQGDGDAQRRQQKYPVAPADGSQPTGGSPAADSAGDDLANAASCL